jgi:small GTP-binding protein
MSSDFTTNSFRVVVVGTSGVGKTAIVERLVMGDFKEESQPTIGVDFKSYTLQVDGESVKLQIWDTAGQDRFRSVAKTYFRNAVGAILMFDLTNRQSFDELNIWINDLNTLAAPNAHIILIGNKLDLEEDRQIVESEAQGFAQRYNLVYFETSAKKGDNVAEAFVRLGTEILRKVKDGQIMMVKPPPIAQLQEVERKSEHKKCC